MIYEAVGEFCRGLPAKGALLGLDPGAKRIGVAVCDPSRLIASPLLTVERESFLKDCERLFAAYDARACVGLVIGLPLNMDGSSGSSAQSARAFARNLLRKRDMAILLWDERLSTAAVSRAMIEADVTRAKRARQVDQLAAAYMLQGAIDALANAGASLL